MRAVRWEPIRYLPIQAITRINPGIWLLDECEIDGIRFVATHIV